MLKIIYTYGGTDSLDLNQSNLTGDATVDRNSDYVRGLVAGRLVQLDADGKVELADGSKFVEGFIINDASGYEFENIPALASGKVPVITGGGVVVTDQVEEDDIVIGDALYVKAGGLLTKTKPSETSVVFAYARTSNSASDKSLTVRFV